MRIKLDDGIVIDTTSLKYLGADVDRHDNVRVFVRRHGAKARIRDWSSLGRDQARPADGARGPP